MSEEKIYQHIADVLFRELDLLSYDHLRTFSDKKEMIEEYARATVIEALVEILLKANKECGDFHKFNEETDRVEEKISEKRLHSMTDMQPPYKELLMHYLMNNLNMRELIEKEKNEPT